MSVLIKHQPLVPDGIELRIVPRYGGYDGALLELKRTSDGVSTVMRLDYDINKLHWVAQLLAYDNLFTLVPNSFTLYKDGKELRDVTAGN